MNQTAADRSDRVGTGQEEQDHPAASRVPRGRTGLVVLEAVFIYPVVFMLLVFVMFLGDTFYQRARVEAAVLDAAVLGGAEIGSSTLPHIVVSDSGAAVLDPSQIQNDPYRFLFNGPAGTGTESVTATVKENVDALLSAQDASIFGLAPRLGEGGAQVDYSSRIVQGEFAVSMSYGLSVPVSTYLMPDGKIDLSLDASASTTVTPMGEFVRTVDMMDDLHEASGGAELADSVRTIVDAISGFRDVVSSLFGQGS